MARKIHKSLHFEKKERDRTALMLAWMSDKVYDVESAIGHDRLAESFWSWGTGFRFNNLDKEEMKKVQKIMECPEMEKKITEYGVSFMNTHLDTGLVLRDKPLTFTLEFTFDLPETCKVTYKTEWEKIDPKDVKIEDGNFLRKKVETVIDCSEPEMMKTLFKENGVKQEEVASGI